MKGLDLKSFYAQSLGVSAPWKVTDLAFDGDQSLVRITVECAAGVVWADPETGERAEIKGWRERTPKRSVSLSNPQPRRGGSKRPV